MNANDTYQIALACQGPAIIILVGLILALVASAISTVNKRNER